ncbi:hypothetical protein BLNAU_20628 [Blattamonas nauphoetae]|uniref:Uncharacterized protein n=1 Tax=Blattamonas nauphoetae TaxID=2049346 RepID=A0ABQ9WY59_9EUKA|nr:hypothetical protein BLNAU_20628 [Blattamonas nauphoetae]
MKRLHENRKRRRLKKLKGKKKKEVEERKRREEEERKRKENADAETAEAAAKKKEEEDDYDQGINGKIGGAGNSHLGKNSPHHTTRTSHPSPPTHSDSVLLHRPNTVTCLLTESTPSI